MKKVLIIAEKKSQSEIVANCLLRNGVVDFTTSIDSVITLPMSWWTFKIPRTISQQTIPFTRCPTESDLIRNPVLNLNPDRGMPMPLAIFGSNMRDEEITWGEDRTESIKDALAEIAQRLPEYDGIYLLPDADHSGWASMYRWLGQLDRIRGSAGTGHSIKADGRVQVLNMLYGLDDDSMDRAFNEKTLLSDAFVQNCHTAGYHKWLFDYWWNYNSAAVLSQALNMVGVTETRLVSKYMLMMLHILDRWGKAVDYRPLIHAMGGWLGSGKYKPSNWMGRRTTPINSLAGVCYRPKEGESSVVAEDDGFHGSIGSPMSVSEIIENLSVLGLIREEPNGIEVTSTGRSFLALCHKSTFDPDLPFRLWIWCQEGNESAMRRYINTVFGKQKRYLSKMKNARA